MIVEKQEFLEQIFNDHMPFTRRTLQKMLSDKRYSDLNCDLDDLIQDVYLRLAELTQEKNIEKYIETNNGIKALLEKLSKEVIQHHKRHVAVESLSSLTMDAYNSNYIDTTTEEMLNKDDFNEKIKILNKQYRRALKLHYLYRCSEKEITEMMHLSNQDVCHNLLKRARSQYRKKLNKVAGILIAILVFATMTLFAYKNIEAFRNLVDTLFRVPRTPIISNDLGDAVEFENKDKNSSFADFVFQLPKMPEGFKIDQHKHIKGDVPKHIVIYKNGDKTAMFQQTFISGKLSVSANNMYGHLKKAKVNGNTAYYLNSPNSTILFWGDSETKTLNQLSFWFTVTRKKAIEMAESLIEE